MGKLKIKKKNGSELGKILLNNKTDRITIYVEPGFMISFFEGKKIYALIDDPALSQVITTLVDKEFVQGIRDRMILAKAISGSNDCNTYIKSLTNIAA